MPGMRIAASAARGVGEDTPYSRAALQRAVARVHSAAPAHVQRAVFAAACTVHEFCNGAELPSSALAEVAYAVRSPVGQEPQYDLSWETPDATMVAEVKSLTARNEERQLRLGLGQVLRYRHRSRRPRDLVAPFNSDSDANYLGWLNRLARIDRHRTLVTGAARLAQLEPVLQVPDGSVVTVEWGERTVVDGRADAARITVRPYKPGMEVSVNPRIGIDPEIAEWSRSPFWSKLTFDERLKMMQIFVAGEIATYEYDCTGQSRKAEFVDRRLSRRQ